MRATFARTAPLTVLAGASPGHPAALLISAGAAVLRLDLLGMGPCVLNVDLKGPVVTLNARTTASGTADLVLALPDAPVVIGDVFLQWVHDMNGPWPTPLGVTAGLRAEIR